MLAVDLVIFESAADVEPPVPRISDTIHNAWDLSPGAVLLGFATHDVRQAVAIR